jgi:hypothetical protein
VFNVPGAAVLIEMLSAVGIFTVPSIIAIEMVVDVAPEVVASVVPRTRADEDASRKPFGAVIAIGSAIIGWVIEVPVRTLGRRPNLHRDLGLHFLRRSRKAERRGGDQEQVF